nr:MAG TPA: hypothetical protein [Bacteriophage sp.]
MPVPRICQFPFAHTLICCRFAYSIYWDPSQHFLYTFHTVHCFVIIVYFSLFHLTLYKYTLALFPPIFTLFYAYTLDK